MATGPAPVRLAVKAHSGPMQLATALQMGAAALVTHDRDFSAVQGLPVLMGE